MEIKTVAIIGAGAIGSYFIWGLSDYLKEHLWIVAQGERKEKLEKEGVMINHQHYSIHVKTPQEAKGVDLLLVATKYGALQKALDDIEQIIDEHTIVMSLLNGVDSEDIIGQRIGQSHMLYSFMKIAAERYDSHTIFNNDVTPGLFFGEKESQDISERMEALVELLKHTPIHYHARQDIMSGIWDKYALNISQNLVQAILNCGVGAYDDSEHAGFLSQKLRDEVIAVAAQKGIFVRQKIDSRTKKASLKRARYSTLQDLDAKRHTEIEMLAGTMIKLGKEVGVSTPYNEFVYHAIKALEEKNDGLFDYE